MTAIRTAFSYYYSVVVRVAVHIKRSRVSSMSFVYMSSCHPTLMFLHACSWRRRAWGMNPPGKCLPLRPDSSMKISANFIDFYPLKKSYLCSVWHGPPPGGLLLSILAPKWAASTLTQCTQHCVPVSQLHVPHQNSTSTCFSTV